MEGITCLGNLKQWLLSQSVTINPSHTHQPVYLCVSLSVAVLLKSKRDTECVTLINLLTMAHHANTIAGDEAVADPNTTY